MLASHWFAHRPNARAASAGHVAKGHVRLAKAQTPWQIVGLLRRGGPFLWLRLTEGNPGGTLGQQRKVTRPALDGRKLWLSLFKQTGKA